MPNFGTYEGHRLLTSAMDKTVDRISRKYEVDEANRLKNAQMRMDQEKFAEEKRQFDVNNQYKEFAFDEMKKNIDREETGRNVAKDLLGDIRPDSYSIIDPETGLLRDRETVANILSGPLGKTYIEDVNRLAPDISIEKQEQIASDTSRRHGQRVMDSIIGELSKNNMTMDDLATHLEASDLTGNMDDYLRRAMGINPDDEATINANPLLKALYGTIYDQSKIGSASDYGITSTRHDDTSKSKSQENMLMKAMEKFGKYSKDESSWYSDDSDEINISQGSDGSWTLKEKDVLSDDEYKIEFDDKGPFVKSGWAGKKIYLNNSEQFEDLESLLE